MISFSNEEPSTPDAGRLSPMSPAVDMDDFDTLDKVPLTSMTSADRHLSSIEEEKNHKRAS